MPTDLYIYNHMRAHNQLAALLTDRPMVKGILRKLRSLWDRIYTSFTAPVIYSASHLQRHARPRSTILNSHLHVLRAGAPLRNKGHPTTV